ncbi:MAG: hypothetical protein RBU25_18345, partial [Lentisphaeria bacterium]|nr:hypothetical protein [Lentisphaeria bacterium]
MSREPQQLKMDFGGGNPFADTLRAARFMLVVEQNVPAADQALPSAVALGRALAERAADEELVAALSLTDRLRHPATHDPVAFAEELVKDNRLPVMLTIAGKGSTPDRVL